MTLRPGGINWASLLTEARALAGRGELARSAEVLMPALSERAAPVAVLRGLASALRAQGRHREACPVLERIVALEPTPVSEHNLAAALGDAGDVAGAVAAARRALDRGGTAPETWLVLARALSALGRLDEADRAFDEALARRPAFEPALRDKAQLIWMRTGDADAALAPIDACLRVSPGPVLAILRAAVARDILGDRPAYEGLRPWLGGGRSAAIEAIASSAASGFDPALALTHAQAAVAASPGEASAVVARAAALIAAGRTVEALPDLEREVARPTPNLYALALRQLAWRLLGDARALGPGDYAKWVRVIDLDPPSGRDPGTWLTEAATALRGLHPFRAEPFGQSIRSGAQSALDPRFAGDPAIDALFEALRAPLDQYALDLHRLEDRPPPAPMAARIAGAWSVRLTSGGRHKDHVHPQGWISSALYVALPETVADEPRAGWIRFGGASLGVGLTLAPEYWVEPCPGRLVLFPSTFWHGTEPFAGPGERLSVAFDARPAP